MNAVVQTVISSSLLDLIGKGSPIRDDIPNAHYHADRSCVSVSGLKQLLRSPAHFRAYLDGEKKETPAMFFGSAIHARLLEPQVFDKEYVVAPAADKRSKEYKEFEIANADKKLLSVEQMATLLGMERSVQSHRTANSLLLAGLKEYTIVWQDEETGIWLKIRPDCLCPNVDTGVCFDLKSTDDASPQAFARSCVAFDYDLQAAFYLAGLRTIFRRDMDFAFGAIEKSEPFGVAVYGADDDMLKRGTRRMRQALNTLKQCRETDTWPSYQPGGDYELLEWPRWAA